jgi:hypothetical protein
MALQYNKQTKSTICDDHCLPGQFKPAILYNQDPKKKSVVISCQPCSENCLECSNFEVCDKCSCLPNDICYYKTFMSANDVICWKGCPEPRTFSTLDKSCINCALKITGCVRCTDDSDNRCITSQGVKKSNCDYETTCTRCSTIYEISASGDSCCLVKNCDVCSKSDSSVCHKCRNDLFVMSQKYIGTDIDRCVTKVHCTKIAKMPANGFYTSVNSEDVKIGSVKVCLPCKKNCEACREPDPMLCRKCINNRKDRIFFLSNLGQCCAVEGCNDCSGFDGASIYDTKTKYAEKTKDLMCQKCM